MVVGRFDPVGVGEGPQGGPALEQALGECAVVFGLGMGGVFGIQSQLMGRYWGRKAFGSIGGIVSPFILVSGITAPVFTGWIYDTTGNYSFAFNMILILAIVSIGIMYFVSPPKPPAKITKITEFF